MVEHDIWFQVHYLLQAYADAIDRRDLDGLLDVFTEDVVWDYFPNRPFVGREMLGKIFTEAFPTFKHTSHNVCPPVVKLGSQAGTLESTAYFTAAHLKQDSTRYTVYGRYVDLVRATDSGLRIYHRRIIAHLTDGTTRPYTFLEVKA